MTEFKDINEEILLIVRKIYLKVDSDFNFAHNFGVSCDKCHYYLYKFVSESQINDNFKKYIYESLSSKKLDEFYKFMYNKLKYEVPHISCDEHIENKYKRLLDCSLTENKEFYDEFRRCHYTYLGKKAQEEKEDDDVMVKPAIYE